MLTDLRRRSPRDRSTAGARESIRRRALLGVFAFALFWFCAPWREVGKAAAGLLAGSPSAQPPAQTGKKWALLIGVAKYQSTEISSLRYPVRDVDALAASLQKLGFAPERILAMTSDAPRTSGLYPTSKNVQDQLTNLATIIKPEDTLVVFFAGHSFLREGANRKGSLLAVVNTNPLSPDALDATGLLLDKLREKVRAIPAEQVLYLMDANHNDPTPGREDGDNPRTLTFTEEMQKVIAETGADARKGMTPPRVAVLYASAVSARSYENDGAKQGVFTQYLLDALSGKGANDKKQMTVDTIARYTGEAAKADWNLKNPGRQQNPELVASAGQPILLNPYRPGDIVDAPVEKVDTRARLTVKIEPAEASVRVNGQAVANGEYTLDLVESEEKDVEISAYAPEYKGQVLKTKMVRGKVVPITITLEKAEPAPPPVPTNYKDNADIIKIPAGEFSMGSPDNDSNADRDEKPQHKVYVNAFWMYRFPVTVGQYEQFCGETNRSMPDPPPFNNDWERKDDPMVNVRWEDAVAYAEWAGGRLPTEAEWERAARGDSTQVYPWGNSFEEGRTWASVKTPKMTTASVLRTTNIAESPLGVRDMTGHVWQWCADWYMEDYYRSSPSRNPQGPTINGFYRSLRGGSFMDKYSKEWRTANRNRGGFRSKNVNWGFRVVLPVYASLRQGG